MRKILLFIILSVNFIVISSLKAQINPLSPREGCVAGAPLHEVRAVWLTTIGGIDWPHTYSQSPYSAKRQQQEFCEILDKLSAAGINTILLQTRIRATTIFDSSMEPWDGCLSGVSGKSPGYDVLDFCIRECHKRGMKLHAWVVTLPVGRWNSVGCRRLRITCPELLKRIGDEVYMNPEKSGTSTYLASFCGDLVKRYDVDGIHLDYCRYPDGWGMIRDRDQGRENITRIVHAVANTVRIVKPWVQMSCSPVGKYADTMRQWSHGWNARDAVCQDAVKWLHDGDMDALYPMMYFRDESFYPFAIDWNERSNGKIIAAGLGIYFLDMTQKNWPLSDVSREFWVLRKYGMGNAMFRSKFFTDNTKGVYDFYRDAFAPLPSLQPAMTWLSDKKPIPPKELFVTQDKTGGVSLSWESSSGASTLLSYNLYGSDSYPVDITKAENLLAGNLQQMSIELGRTGHVTFFAVTATDRYGNESDAMQSCGNSVSPGTEQHVFHGMPLFPCANGVVDLSRTDLPEGKLIIISSILGNALTSAFVKAGKDGGRYIVLNVTPGHYLLHSISKKDKHHLLGRIEIKP